MTQPPTGARISPNGNTYWGEEIDAGRFHRAEKQFPNLLYVLNKYYPTPQKPDNNNDAQLLIDYKEDQGEELFNGLIDELREAASNYQLAATLVNGILGTYEDAETIRGNLISLRQQLTETGEFDPTKEYDNDPYFIESAPNRIQQVLSQTRTFPFGPWKGKDFTLVQYFFGSIVAVAAGWALTWIPFIGTYVGTPILYIGIIGIIFCAIWALTVRGDILDPVKAKRRREALLEEKERKEQKRQERGLPPKGGKESFFSWANPFKH